jgi:hypothetical protein
VDKKFASGNVPLADLLGQARTGALQLPDFQRGWVWDDEHIASLLASVSLSYPIGAVMTLRTGNPDVRFKPRPLEGVSLPGKVEPEYLLLDGQQRTTSLYLALCSGQPVPTRDTRKAPMERRYFADIARCVNPEADREDAIRSVPADGTVRNFRSEVLLDLSTRTNQVSQRMFPLDIVLDPVETAAWQMEYVQGDDVQERLSTWMAFYQAVVLPFMQYQVPIIELSKSTPKEAVCQVFEKVNTGGVTLTVFELLTATYAADDFNLRVDWDSRRVQFQAHSLLSDFAATDFLQILTLLATYQRRSDYLRTRRDAERAPAVSCKRRDVLRLELADYLRWADPVTEVLPYAVQLLHGEGVHSARDLPYRTQLVPLAAILVALGDRREEFGVREQLRRWYWCGVLGEMYGGSTETRFGNDLQDVLDWIDGGSEPRTITEAQFQADRLLTLRRRNSAAYKGVYALQMKRGARDFHTGTSIDLYLYVDDAVDIHHIFPRAWCDETSIDPDLADCVVNKTPIDAKTNRIIGKKAPSTYLTLIETKAKIEPDQLDEILLSHDVEPLHLRSDDFRRFFSDRFRRLIGQIEQAMGKPVNRAQDGSDDPFHRPAADDQEAAADVRTLLSAGESTVVEFKSTGRKNLHTGGKDPAIEWSVIKSVAGFLNKKGGVLLVGVADDGAVVGIEEDYPLLGSKQNSDGWELWLTTALTTALGKAAVTDVDVTYVAVDGRTVASLTVRPASGPVFATPKGGKQTFYVRINSSTQELVGHDLLAYKAKRWPD